MFTKIVDVNWFFSKKIYPNKYTGWLTTETGPTIRQCQLVGTKILLPKYTYDYVTSVPVKHVIETVVEDVTSCIWNVIT